MLGLLGGGVAGRAQELGLKERAASARVQSGAGPGAASPLGFFNWHKHSANAEMEGGYCPTARLSVLL